MEWRDEGVVLSTRPQGEGSAIVEIFTAGHGRHLGVVRGGGSRRMAAVLQPGSQVAVSWRARLDQQIGVFRLEPVQSRAGLLEDPLALAALTSICALLHHALPERAPHEMLYGRSMGLLTQMLEGGDWPGSYLRWEMALLDEIGFGLDLGRCALTGTREDLAFVSPRSGRAVSRGAAGPWAARLLPLPQVLLGQGPASRAEMAQGLALTGHFLQKALEDQLKGGPLPEARGRLVQRMLR
jgi:DNA repair protein RecO (recombination protein O)